MVLPGRHGKGGEKWGWRRGSCRVCVWGGVSELMEEVGVCVNVARVTAVRSCLA